MVQIFHPIHSLFSPSNAHIDRAPLLHLASSTSCAMRKLRAKWSFRGSTLAQYSHESHLSGCGENSRPQKQCSKRWMGPQQTSKIYDSLVGPNHLSSLDPWPRGCKFPNRTKYARNDRSKVVVNTGPPARPTKTDRRHLIRNTG